MQRFAVLAASVVALAGSASSIQSFDQKGTVETPRAPLDDGQPLDTPARIQLHGGTTVQSPIEQGGEVRRGTPDNAAGVARRHAGAALRVRATAALELQFEADTAWSPTATTPAGKPIDAPSEPVVVVTSGARVSHAISPDARLGLAIDVGGSSIPIHRSDTGAIDRDVAFLARVALVPSIRRGAVTLFGVAGASTTSHVQPTVSWISTEGDPGVNAETRGMAVVLAAGAAVDLSSQTRLTARVGDALSDDVRGGHFGPQLDVGLAVDLGP